MRLGRDEGLAVMESRCERDFEGGRRYRNTRGGRRLKNITRDTHVHIYSDRWLNVCMCARVLTLLA